MANACREVCEVDILNNSQPIGGPGTVVEIDESIFGKRKYHRGRPIHGTWVLGGVERDSSNCFLVIVPNRRMETLVSAIIQNVLPGTHIITDGWASYHALSGNITKIPKVGPEISDNAKERIMWKSTIGTKPNIPAKPVDENDDDWETDPDFINDVTEEEQRWGSTTVEGSGRTAGAIDMEKLRRETEAADALRKRKDLETGPNASFGYGGKFGVESDRMDKSALGHDHVEKLQQHASQKDYSTGFGGKFGVQTDRVDKSALSWDHKERVEKHTSQKDYAEGFGGKFGVQSDRQDKSAVGWDHVEKIDKHESQKDYSVGFGGKFGVQTDRQDKSAVGWDHHEAPQKHESQLDHKMGFGGKFGVQTDRMDKSAESFQATQEKVGTVYDRIKPDIAGAKPSEMRAKFESISKISQPRNVPSTSAPTVRKIHSKAAAFSQEQNSQQVVMERAPLPKQFDQSKTAFLQESKDVAFESKANAIEKQPGQLDKSKLEQFNNASKIAESSRSDRVSQEIGKIRQAAAHQLQMLQEEEKCDKREKSELETSKNAEDAECNRHIYDDVPGDDVYANIPPENAEEEFQEEIVDTGFSAIALYDYQAADDDEISFDPDDIITHVEQIDEGWWRGMCKGRYGLFPANYVQLQE